MRCLYLLVFTQNSHICRFDSLILSCGLRRSRTDIRPLRQPEARVLLLAEWNDKIASARREREARKPARRLQARYDDARTDLTRSAKRLNLPRRKDPCSSCIGCSRNATLNIFSCLVKIREDECGEIYIALKERTRRSRILALMHAF